MLNNLGHDIECSILSIIEMNYKAENGPISKLNVKGIIQSDSTKRVIRPKMVYYAMQNIASIFDDNLLRIKSLHNTNNPTMMLTKDEVSYHKGTDRSLSVYGYAHKTTKKQAFTIWSDEAIPSNTNAPRTLTFTILNGNFEQPVYVDILTGSVYDIPATQWSKKNDIYTFKDISIYDAPIVIADKSVLLGFKSE